MIPYIALIVIPALCTFIAFDRRCKPAHFCVGRNTTPLMRNHNPALPVFFVLLTVLLMLRHEEIGRDLEAYKFYFEIYPTLELRHFDLFHEESLYRLLNWGIGQLTDNYQIFIAATSVITTVPLALLYCEDRRNSYTKMVLFVGMTTFVMMFSGVRQTIAISFGVLAYMCVRDKKPLLFGLCVLLAYGFHHSSFMILLMYPLYYIRLGRKHLWIIVPTIIVSFVFNNQIFSLANSLASRLSDHYDYEMTYNPSYMSLILFAAFAAFSFLIADENKMDKELLGLRNFLLFAVVLQCFAPVHSLAMRLNYYFIIFIPITMAKMMEVPRADMKRISKWAQIIIPLYFTYDFADTLYVAHRTGFSLLDTIPYRFFWK